MLNKYEYLDEEQYIRIFLLSAKRNSLVWQIGAYELNDFSPHITSYNIYYVN